MVNLSNKVVSLERMIGQLTHNFQIVLNHMAAQNQQPHRTLPAFGSDPRFPAPTSHAMAKQQHLTIAPPPNYNSVPRQSQTTPAPHSKQRVEDIRQRLPVESPRQERTSQALTQHDYVTNPFATPYANANVAPNNWPLRQETREVQPDSGHHQRQAAVTNPFVTAQNADVAYHSQPSREETSQKRSQRFRNSTGTGCCSCIGTPTGGAPPAAAGKHTATRRFSTPIQTYKPGFSIVGSYHRRFPIPMEGSASFSGVSSAFRTSSGCVLEQENGLAGQV